MKRPVITVSPSASLPEAVKLMTHHGIRRIVAVNDRKPGKPLGLVTRHDIIERFPRSVNPFSPVLSETHDIPSEIGRIMSRPVITIDSHAPIEDAARLMNERRSSSLPVLHAGEMSALLRKRTFSGRL